MINRVVMMGRLVNDPEYKMTAQDVGMARFRIAVDRDYTRKGEQRTADFFDVVCWRHTADFVSKYFGKGNMIAIDGKLQTRQYQAKDGTNRTAIEIIADGASFTGERTERPVQNQNTQPQRTTPAPSTALDDVMDDDDSDPFTWGK